jgi:hypothetical protein
LKHPVLIILLVLSTALPALAQSEADKEDSERDAAIFGENSPLADPPPNSEATEPSEDTSDTEAREEDMFGDSDETPAGGPPVRAKRPRLQDPFNEEPNLQDRLAGKLQEQDDPLQIGGFLYIRPTWSFVDSEEVEDHPISMPNLLELYLDGRPSDRVRAYVRGRLSYDPTAGQPLFGGLLPPADEVSADLVQFWLNFDIARVVYVTVGQLQVRWGASRIWNPTDVLNQTRRDPTAPFDQRVGIPALKLHFPVESLGWNFYLIGLMDDVTSIDKAGVAARAEFVVETAEIGLSTAYRNGIDPKLGLDWSIGVWDFDITGEVGLTFGEKQNCTIDDADVESCDDELDPWVQVSVGIEYGIRYNDDDTLFLGLEYFYNQRGHESIEKALYTSAGVRNADELIAQSLTNAGDDPLAAASAFSGLLGGLEFFYTGRHYGALFIAFPSPGSWDDGYITTSTLGNISDQSFLSRIDISWRVLTYLQVQMFLQVAYGKQGELRIGTDTFSDLNTALGPLNALVPDQDLTFRIPTQVATIGLWLRLDI